MHSIFGFQLLYNFSHGDRVALLWCVDKWGTNSSKRHFRLAIFCIFRPQSLFQGSYSKRLTGSVHTSCSFLNSRWKLSGDFDSFFKALSCPAGSQGKRAQPLHSQQDWNPRGIFFTMWWRAKYYSNFDAVINVFLLLSRCNNFLFLVTRKKKLAKFPKPIPF